MASRQLSRSLSTTAMRLNLVEPPVRVHGVEGRYAHALYSAATKEKSIDQVDKDMTWLQSALARDIRFREFVSNPLLPKALKIEAFESVLNKQKANKLTVNALRALTENGRVAKLPLVIESFQTMMRVHRGEVECIVTSAQPLDSSYMSQLQATLESFITKDQKIMLTTKVDPNIMGGLIVQIGDKYVDMSMAHKLKTYTELLTSS